MPVKQKNEEILTHLDAAYNLARWLMKNEHDARDVVQDAFIRAFRSNSDVENVKTWFLATVRNTAFSAMNKKPRSSLEGDDAIHTHADPGLDPELLAIQRADLENVRTALFLLSEEHREIFVLREIEEFSYQELSETLRVPIGTVMSRLARARSKLVELLQRTPPLPEGAKS